MKDNESTRIFQGVIGGLAKYYGYNETFCKLGFAITLFFSSSFAGIFLFSYLALVFIMDDYDEKNDIKTEGSE